MDDFRIQLPPTLIDFTDAKTGTPIDDYPEPGDQPRFDWIRSILVGLLTSQAANDEPNNFGPGTPWFNLSLAPPCMLVFNGTSWVSLANAIQVGQDNAGNVITLAAAYQTIQALLGQTPTGTFSGKSQTDGAALIPIPVALQPTAGPNSRPLVWANGALIDPRSCQFIGSPGSYSIQLSGGNVLNHGTKFTVVLVGLDNKYFYLPDVLL